ncbi:MAG TPA: bifunctional riboflavin kinase/FAD synthetase [Acidimicrobiales bacterium]|nr:bifunctional riboflavin kinase/FAD synthetase [Acidimicrobiales bacterium]
MEVVAEPGRFPAFPRGSIITIGAYDGVHRGHQAIIGEVRSRAAAQGCASVVVTFDTHPARVVRPESAPLLLTDLDQKLELLAATGVDFTVVVHFDEERAAETAEDFVSDLLVGKLSARGIVVGHDFHFGHDRRGNVALLSEMGNRLGFDVVGMHLVADRTAGQVVSSTRIRGLLAEGDVVEAAALLGRPHEVRGTVDKGDGRAGSQLGFPTANVAVPPDILLPLDGIYAGWYLRPDGTVLTAAISLGLRPTFYPEGGPRLLEAYLLDFSGDLYGEAARVRFVSRIRDEVRFDSAEALVEQMHRDVAEVRTALRPR